MKIVHLNYFDINGGAARAVYRINNSLLKKGINSRMWVNKATSGNWSVEEPTSKIDKILNEIRPRLINYSLVKMLKTENKIIHSPSVLSSRWVKHVNNSDADIVHLHWIQNEMLSIKDIPRIKKPIVWTLHDMWAFCGAEHYTSDNRWRDGYYSTNRPKYESGFDLNHWSWQRKKKYWTNPIQIVTPSKWLSNCVNESKLMHNWPVSVVPNPIDINRWRPLDKKTARDQLNLSNETSLIVFGAIRGAKDPRKGYDLLLEALKNLKADRKVKKIELIVFGQCKPQTQPELGFPIHFMGHLHDDISLQVLYSASDVMVIPSRQDNLPNTALEAQACDTPVVSFNIGGFADIIEHQKTGYLAKPFDTKDLAKGISWTLDNFKSQRYKNYIHKQAVLKFNEKKIAEQYINIYKRLLKQI